MLRVRPWGLGLCAALVPLLVLCACGSDDDTLGTMNGGNPALVPDAATPGLGGDAALPPGIAGGALAGSDAAVPVGPGGGTTGGGTTGGGTTGGGGGTTGGAATGGGTTGGAAGGTTGGGGVPNPTFIDGPVDGDPSKPVVAIPSVACGGSKGGLDGIVGGGFGGFPVPGSPNLKIGGRDVILTYPCNKREGAVVTFILNLHGTMPDDGLKFYQHGYFAAHKLSDSHNLIIATPKSVVSQWGNGDNGVDKPHLYEVIDWVYTNFSKFKIAGLWVAGHSWGSMFAKTFVCDEKLKERARGVIGQSGGTTGVGGGFGALGGGMASAGCADRLSQIHTVGDAEAGATGGVPDQTAAAMKHGCGAKSGPKDLGNNQQVTTWPNCSPGWTHFNVTMGAHEHTTPINPEVVKYIVEQIKATEKKP